jgi:transcriptional regulator with XRE-family HTH domain
VKQKETADLQQELMETADLDRFLSENSDQFLCRSTSEALLELFYKRDMNKATLAKRSGMSEVYLHQLFSARRNPTRGRLLCLCFGLNATVEETQHLLKTCGFAPLYVKDQREAIILHCLNHGMTLPEVNDALFTRGFTPLTGNN